MAKPWLAVGVAAAALCISAPASAQKARVLIVVQERVEGQAAGSKGAEPALSELLIDKGFQVVERYESDGVRSRIPLERILNDEVAGNEVSAINADLLVVGRVDLDKEVMPYGLQGKAFTGSIELRVLLTDSGRVVYSGRASGKGAGSSSDVAARIARKLSDDLVKALEGSLAQRDVIELRVAGLDSATHADELAAQLGKLAGVQSAKVRFVSADDTIIDLQARGTEAAALDGALAKAGLVVVRRSANVVEARHDAAAAARREILVATFANQTGNAALDWIGDVGPEIAETELASSQYLTPRAVDKRPSASPRAAAAAARTAGADLALVVDITAVGGKLRFAAKVVPAKGKTLVSAQVFGDDSDAIERIKELTWKVDQLLYQKLAKKSSLAGYVSKVKKWAPPSATVAGAGAAAARVVVAAADIAPVFPAQLARYAQEPFGHVTLENVGKQPATQVRLGVRVGDLTGEEQSIAVGKLAAGATTTVPLQLVFERDQLIAVDQRRPVRVELTVRYHDGAEQKDDAITESTVLHDRNAMNWRDGDAIAAFVTSRDPVVRRFAQAVLKETGDLAGVPRGLGGAVALLDAMQALGIRYRRDPVAAYGDQVVDAVMFPRETLAEGAGDCDDLAVLYASLLAATGRGARIVYTPGHVFVAVDAELPIAKADLIGGTARALDIDGRAWVPVEVTKLEGGFVAAWDAGIAEIGRYRGDAGKIEYVDVGLAWAKYPAFPIPGEATAPALPKSLAEAVRSDARAIADGRFGGASKPLPKLPDVETIDLEALAASDPWELVRLGTTAAQRGDHARAIALLTRAGDVKAVGDAARNNLGNVFTLLGRYGDAIQQYEGALADKGIRGQVLTNLGFAYYKAGDGDKARGAFRKAKTREAKQLMQDLGLAKRETKPGGGGKPAGGSSAEASTEYGMRAADERVEPMQILIWIDRK